MDEDDFEWNTEDSDEDDFEWNTKDSDEDILECISPFVRPAPHLQESGLISSDGKRRISAWINAISDDNGLQLVLDLIQNGANVNEPLAYDNFYAGFPYVRLRRLNSWSDNKFRKGTPLLFALLGNNLEIAEALVQAGADVNAHDGNGSTPLHFASQIGSHNIALVLIAKGADVKATNRMGYTPLHIALKWNYPEIAEALIEAGADVNALAGDGTSPLHTASNINWRIVALLIEKGAKVNAIDRDSFIPLHAALKCNNTEIVETLINAGAYVNALDDDEATPLHHVMRLDCHVTALQIENEDSTKVESNDACANARESASRLIKAGADVNARDNLGRTPLHVLSRNKSVSVTEDSLGLLVEMLMDKGADIYQVDDVGETALHMASMVWFYDMVKLLLEHGASVNALSDTKETPLHRATKYTKREISDITKVIGMLLRSGADMEALNSSYYTPLDNAKSHYYNRDIAAFMLSWKLKQAATDGNQKLVQRVLDEGVNEFYLCDDWWLGDPSYFEIAAVNGHVNIVKLLYEQTSKVKSTGSLKNTPLHWACEYGHYACVRLLLERGASLKKRNVRSQIPLDLAKNQGHPKVVDLLEWWPSRTGVRAFFSSILRQVKSPKNKNLQNKIDKLALQLIESEHKCTILRQEQEIARLQIEELLSDTDTTDGTGKKELKATMDAMREKTDKIDTLNAQMQQIMDSIDELKTAKLHGENNSVTSLADEQETMSATSFLTDSFKSFRESFKKKTTCLFEAVTAGDEDLVVQLLGKHSDLNKRDKDKQTPLFLACKYNRYDIVRLLIARGADVNVCNKDNATPLYSASENGYADVVDCLLDNKSSVNFPTKKDATPLLIAADNGHVTVVNSLMNKGANVNMAMKGGYTPLYVAARNDRREVVQILLERRANVNASSDKMMSPLHRAAIEGHLEVVELLLEYGANPDALNGQNETPDRSAEKHGQINVRDLIVSWRNTPEPDRLVQIRANQERRKEQQERLRTELTTGDSSNLPVLCQQLATEILEAAELRETVESLLSQLDLIPEEDENVDGESVYDVSEVRTRLVEARRSLSMKRRSVDELRMKIAENKRKRNERINIIIFNESKVTVHGTFTGDIGTFNHGNAEDTQC